MRFDHPNVCRILHVGETTDGMLYLVMPYLRGESLNDAETRRGPYPVNEAVMLLVQVCQGLQHAHQLGVIHRDLKPENIMLVPDDTVPGGIRAVVMDFGLGKAIQPDPELVRLTQTGVILGTPEFMSPEQVRGEKIDERSDIFALGVVAFELFTGQLPFAGRTSQESMMARLRGTSADLPARCGRTFRAGRRRCSRARSRSSPISGTRRWRPLAGGPWYGRGEGFPPAIVREVTPSRQRQCVAACVLWRVCRKCGDETCTCAAK